MLVYINPYRTIFAKDALKHVSAQISRATRKFFVDQPAPELGPGQTFYQLVQMLAEKYDEDNMPKPYRLPDDRVVKLGDGEPVWVRMPDGRVRREVPFGGCLYFSFGPTDMSAKAYDDGTVEEVEYGLYDFTTKGWRWFRTEEEARRGS